MIDFETDHGASLQEILGDDFYNDPETKQQPTKMFDNIEDIPGLVKFAASSQRELSSTKNSMSGMVKIPDEKSPTYKDDLVSYNKAIGVPPSADDYELLAPEGQDKVAFETVANMIRPALLEAGISSAKIGKVWGSVVEGVNKFNQTLEAAGQAATEQDIAAQKEKLGEKYDNYVAECEKALTKTSTGPILKEFFTGLGILDHSIIRAHLAEIAPLVNQGSTVVGDTAIGVKDEDEAFKKSMNNYDDVKD